MYALQTVGSTTSSVKDDTEVLEIDDNGNSIVDQIISNSNNIKRTGNLTANGYQSSKSYPETHPFEQDVVDENVSVGLCFWALFQAVGLACVASIICLTIIYQNGYIDTSSSTQSMSITKEQFPNWHFLLTTFGFIYLYANSIFLIKHNKSNVSLPYIMLHTFAFFVSALGLYVMYTCKEIKKPADSKFYTGHLYSIHAWMGALAAALFTFQWLSVVFTYVMPCLQSIGLPLGRMYSLYTILISSICLVSGINGHAVKSDEEYGQYSIKSLVLNGFGVLVICFLFLIIYLVIKPNKKYSIS